MEVFERCYATVTFVKSNLLGAGLATLCRKHGRRFQTVYALVRFSDNEKITYGDIVWLLVLSKEVEWADILSEHTICVAYLVVSEVFPFSALIGLVYAAEDCVVFGSAWYGRE